VEVTPRRLHRISDRPTGGLSTDLLETAFPNLSCALHDNGYFTAGRFAGYAAEIATIAGIGANALRAYRGFKAAETGEAAAGEVADVGHAGIHQFPGVQAGKSQFFDGENLGNLSNTDAVTGVLQKNGNTRFVMRGANDVGVDRTTGLPTNIYTVIRKPDGSVLTMFPGTSPMS
jgi:hypothetical protein